MQDIPKDEAAGAKEEEELVYSLNLEVNKCT